MPRSALTGSRIRERRLLKGMRQAELARAAGISASYLNLIEHNRRRVGAALLDRCARALGVAPALLSEGAEAALIEGLRDAAGGATGGAAGTDAPGHAGAPPPPELDRIEEFAGRFPGWAALGVAQQARLGRLERTVAAMSDRMTHDPYVTAALHDVLSAVTAVRSTAAILADTEDIEPEWQARFRANLRHEAERLAEGAGALVAYLDGSVAEEGRLVPPQEEVEAWLDARGHHLAELEAGGDPAALVAAAPALGAASARRIALRHAERYAADAVALPLADFAAAVAEEGPDPGALARRFGVDAARVFRRLAALPQDLAGGPVGLVICDGAGALTCRKAVEGFALPRYGAPCPLWPLYQALSRPLAPVRARLEMAGRSPRRFLCYAISQPLVAAAFEGPQVLEATMLILPDRTGAGEAVQPVGATCRICPREGCPARREPSVLSEEF